MQSIVESLLTNYRIEGSGKAVLLVHGWGDNMNTFNILAHDLAKEYKVVRLDLPGFGDSQPPEEVWNLDNYARFVQSFLDKIKVNNIHAIIGHSNGGALAVRGLGEGLLKANKLVLLSSSGVRPAKNASRTVYKVIAKTGKVATFWFPEQKKQKLRKKLYGVAGSDMLVAPHLQETFKQTVRQDVQSDAANIKAPTLLIYGDEDKATPAKDGKLLASHIAKSSFEIIKGAGHFVHQDKPNEVLTKIEGFLK